MYIYYTREYKHNMLRPVLIQKQKPNKQKWQIDLTLFKMIVVLVIKFQFQSIGIDVKSVFTSYPFGLFASPMSLSSYSSSVKVEINSIVDI